MSAVAFPRRLSASSKCLLIWAPNRFCCSVDHQKRKPGRGPGFNRLRWREIASEYHRQAQEKKQFSTSVLKKVSEGALTSFLLSNAAFTKSELIKALNISSASVGLLINELLDKGVIERDSQLNGSGYSLRSRRRPAGDRFSSRPLLSQ